MFDLDYYRIRYFFVRHWRALVRDSDISSKDILITVLVGAIVAYLIYHQRARIRRILKHHSLLLTLRLSLAHHLKFPQIILLFRLARFHKLKSPLVLFLQPEHFTSSQTLAAFSHDQAELQNLKQILFAPSQTN